MTVESTASTAGTEESGTSVPGRPRRMTPGSWPGRPGATVGGRIAAATRSLFGWLGTRPTPVIVLLSVITGLIISSILLIITTEQLRIAWGGLFRHPGNALDVTWGYLSKFYAGLFKGAIGDPAEFSKAFADPSVATWKRALTPIGTTITAAAPLAIAGVGLTICYRAGAFNIGSHAQVIGGGLGASWVGFSFPGMPWFPHVLLAFAAAAIGGGICGLIPGLLKAFTGASEVIVTIMGNYVMANVLTYLLSSSFFKVSGQGVDNPVGKSTLPSTSLTPIFPVFGVNAGVIVAVLVVIFAAALLNRSRLGFEMQIAGAGSRAADVSGIRRNLVFVSAFVVSGAVVGLAGAVQVLGVSNQLQVGFGGDIGTLAILVAFVGNVKPAGAAAAALLYGGLQAGGLTAQFDSGISYQLTGVMQALIVMFVTAPALIASIYRLRQKKSVRFLG